MPAQPLTPAGAAPQTLSLSPAQHLRVRLGRAVTVFPLVWSALAFVFLPDVLLGQKPLVSHLAAWTLLALGAAAVSLALRPRGPAAVRCEGSGVRVLDHQHEEEPMVPYARVHAIEATRGVFGWGVALTLVEGRTVDVLMRGATRAQADAWVAQARASRLARLALDAVPDPSFNPAERSVSQESHATV